MGIRTPAVHGQCAESADGEGGAGDRERLQGGADREPQHGLVRGLMAISVVYKYPFDVADAFVIQMPVGAQVLKVEQQNGTPTLWALVNPRAVEVTRRFRIVGTGHPFDADRLTFIATWQQPPFVWHLFEATA